MSSVKPIEPSNPEQPLSGLSNFNDDSETEQPITRPKIRQQALFLSDSEEEDEQTITNKSSRYIKPNQTTTSNVDSNLDPEVEALFAGVEDDDDLFNFAPAAEPLDSAALDKEALERHKRSANADDLIPNIESSTPSMTPSGQQAKEDTATGKGKEKDRQANEKRVAARLDEAMLLGPSGFTKLVSLTQDFKVKGKGYEASSFLSSLSMLRLTFLTYAGERPQ
ncbi:hypothetical protein AX16_004791 [Volvariella volvacea WC 439]|nr:hypothetical protein AX16_004791 [Volvariella volvacea WC 439]